MIYISVEDFFNKAKKSEKLSLEQQKSLVDSMRKGDELAKEKLIENYLPIISSHIKRVGKQFHTLDFLYKCLSQVEKEIEKHDFFQEKNEFSKKIAKIIRRVIVEHIANM